MADPRTLPIPAGHREFAVKVDGQPAPREHQLLAASVVRAANKIASARLVYLDGVAAAGDFPLSNAATFAPGAELEVLAGADGSFTSLFRGVVVRHAIKLRGGGPPQLIVECRDPAFKLTLGRRSACFADQSDADIISSLLADAGLAGEVEATAVVHPQLVQYDATDWDFLVARAAANGMVVLTGGGSLTVKAPDPAQTAVATLLFGATILELDAEIDARRQPAGVRALSWSPAEQALVDVEAADPGFSGPGNLDGDALAAVGGEDPRTLRHVAAARDEAQAWADAEWRRARLEKVSGRLKCEGLAGVVPGDVVTLSGVGERFNGDVLVTAVRHDRDATHGWTTHLQFGALERPPLADAAAPAGGDLLPGVRGLQIGVVTSNEDPDGEHRVRVRLPLVDPDGDGIWARLASLDAGDARGFVFRPEIGDEVVLGFLAADPRGAVILGMLHSSAKAAPLPGADDNPQKGYQSRSKLRLLFDDDKKVVLLETPAGNRLTLSEADKAITIADQNDNRIVLDADGITLQSAKALTLTSQDKCTLTVGAELTIESKSDVTLKSDANVQLEAGAELAGKGGTELKLESGTALGVKAGTELKLEGTAGAELSTSAIATIKGSLIKLN